MVELLHRIDSRIVNRFNDSRFNESRIPPHGTNFAISLLHAPVPAAFTARTRDQILEPLTNPDSDVRDLVADGWLNQLVGVMGSTLVWISYDFVPGIGSHCRSNPPEPSPGKTDKLPTCPGIVDG